MKQVFTRKIFWWRTFVCSSLIFLAIFGSVGCFCTIWTLEGKLQEDSYDQTARLFESLLERNLENSILTLKTVSTIFSSACYSASLWPNCSIPVEIFGNISLPLIAMTSVRTISFAPVVANTSFHEFESFAYRFYEEQGYDDIGISSFGKGIYFKNLSSAHPDLRDRVTNTYGRAHGFALPILMTGNIDESAASIMLDIYAEPVRAVAINRLVDCVGMNKQYCVSSTGIVQLVIDIEFRPATVIYYPISPFLDKSTLVGVVSTAINWDTLFSNMPPSVDGLQCILITPTEKYTFTLNHGNAKFIGMGDRHNKKYFKYSRTLSLNTGIGDTSYSIELYPNYKFVQTHRTGSPFVALVVSFLAICISSCFFFVYDYFVTKERNLVMENKRLFVRFVSHEMRTPLNTVGLGVNIIRKRLEDMAKEPDNREDALNLIEIMEVIVECESNVSIVTEVLNNILDYDKISVGLMDIERKPVNVEEVILSITAPFRVASKSSGVNFIVEIEDITPLRDGSLVLVGDCVKVGHIFRNLISNALKFTPSMGMMELRVGVENIEAQETHSLMGLRRVCLPAHSNLVVTVRDSGTGISPDDISNLFSDGFQINPNGAQHGQGSGIGLWITKQLVEKHSGSISVSSDGEGKGSVFRVVFPLELGHRILSNHPERGNIIQGRDIKYTSNQVLPIEIQQQMVTYKDHQQSQDLSTLDIFPLKTRIVLPSSIQYSLLIVDDALTCRKMVCRLLKSKGYLCLEAGNGQECINVVQSDNVDLILLDSEMPIMTGPEAAKELRRLGYTMPIIGFTGNVLPKDILLFKEHGANDVLPKPITSDVLDSVLDRYLIKQSKV